MVSLWVVALRVRASCARLKPQRSLRSSGFVLECLFDDTNVLDNPISGTTSSCSWATSYWYWANCIGFLSTVEFVSATIPATMLFYCSCAWSNLSITWAASTTSRLRFFSKILILSALSSVKRMLDINLRLKSSISCTTNYSWLYSLYSFFSPLYRRILHRKSTLRLSKRFDLPLPPAHHIFFVETEFDVDFNDFLTSFQCVSIMPSIYVVGTMCWGTHWCLVIEISENWLPFSE